MIDWTNTQAVERFLDVLAREERARTCTPVAVDLAMRAAVEPPSDVEAGNGC